MSERMTVSINDQDFIRWRKNQKNFTLSLRLVVRYFVKRFGDGDVMECMMDLLDADADSSKVPASDIVKVSKDSGANGLKKTLTVRDNDGFLKEPRLGNDFGQTDSEVPEGSGVDPAAFLDGNG